MLNPVDRGKKSTEPSRIDVPNFKWAVFYCCSATIPVCSGGYWHLGNRHGSTAACGLMTANFLPSKCFGPRRACYANRMMIKAQTLQLTPLNWTLWKGRDKWENGGHKTVGLKALNRQFKTESLDSIKMQFQFQPKLKARPILFYALLQCSVVLLIFCNSERACKKAESLPQVSQRPVVRCAPLRVQLTIKVLSWVSNIVRAWRSIRDTKKQRRCCSPPFSQRRKRFDIFSPVCLSLQLPRLH